MMALGKRVESRVQDKYFRIGSVILRQLQHPRFQHLEIVENDSRLGAQNALKVCPVRLDDVLCM